MSQAVLSVQAEKSLYEEDTHNRWQSTTLFLFDFYFTLPFC